MTSEKRSILSPIEAAVLLRERERERKNRDTALSWRKPIAGDQQTNREKYWWKRRYLFRRFDEGILLDEGAYLLYYISLIEYERKKIRRLFTMKNLHVTYCGCGNKRQSILHSTSNREIQVK